MRTLSVPLGRRNKFGPHSIGSVADLIAQKEGQPHWLPFFFFVMPLTAGFALILVLLFHAPSALAESSPPDVALLTQPDTSAAFTPEKAAGSVSGMQRIALLSPCRCGASITESHFDG